MFESFGPKELVDGINVTVRLSYNMKSWCGTGGAVSFVEKIIPAT